MKDTAPEIEELQHRLLMERSGEERFRMAVSMCQSARAIVRSSLPNHLTEADVRVQLFLRLYGDDFTATERVLIAARIRSSAEFEGV